MTVNWNLVNANAAMLCVGYAWWYKRYARLDWELWDCQSEAQEAKLGLGAMGMASRHTVNRPDADCSWESTIED